MIFHIPGQLKGPECRKVISQAIKLRKDLEPLFLDIEHRLISELAIILRVNGSLGSFGAEAIENFKFSEGIAECDVVIRDHNWLELDDQAIQNLLKGYLLSAINSCIEYFEIEGDFNEVYVLLS